VTESESESEFENLKESKRERERVSERVSERERVREGEGRNVFLGSLSLILVSARRPMPITHVSLRFRKGLGLKPL
jgi:hypothetical protein